MPKNTNTTRRAGKKAKREQDFYTPETFFDVGNMSDRKAKAQAMRKNLTAERKEREAYARLRERFEQTFNPSDSYYVAAQRKGFLNGANRLGTRQMQQANIYMRDAINSYVPGPSEGQKRVKNAISASKLEEDMKKSVQERRKVSAQGGGDAMKKANQLVAQGGGASNDFSGAIFNLISMGISAISGNPEIGQAAAVAMKTAWNNRDTIKKIWSTIKNIARNVKNKIIRPKQAKDRMSDPNSLVLFKPTKGGRWGANEVNDAFKKEKEILELQKAIDQDVQDSIKAVENNGTGVSEALFHDRNPSNVEKILLDHAKSLGLPLTNGIEDLTRAVVVRDEDLNKQITLLTEVNNSLSTSVQNFKNMVKNGDLVGLSALMSDLNKTLQRLTFNQANKVGEATSNGFQTLLLESGNQLKTLLEQRNIDKTAYEEARKQLADVEAEKKQLQIEYNNLQKQKAADFQKIDEEVSAKARRVDEVDAQLRELRAKYSTLEEQHQLAKAQINERRESLMANSLEAQKAIVTLNNMAAERNAIAAAGQRQANLIDKMEKAGKQLEATNQQLIAQVDEGKKAIQTEIDKNAEMVLALRERDTQIQGLKNQIASYNGENEQLRAQIADLKQLQSDSQRLIEDKSKELVLANQNNSLTAKEMQEALSEKTKAIRAQNEEYARQIQLLTGQLKEKTDKVTALEAQVNQHNNEIASRDRQIEEGRKAIETSETTVAEYKRRLDSTNGFFTDLNVTNDRLLGELAQLRQQEMDMELTLAEKDQQSLMLNSQIETYVAKLDAVEQDIQKNQTAYENHLRQIQADRDNRLHEKQLEIRSLNEEIRKLNSQIKQYEKTYGKMWAIYPWEKQQMQKLQKQAKERGNQINQIQQQQQDIDIEMRDERNRANEAHANDIQEYQLERRRIRNAMWHAVRNDNVNQTKARKASNKNILEPKAPDWNLQPNQKIADFWSNFYEKSFHYM